MSGVKKLLSSLLLCYNQKKKTGNEQEEIGC